MNTLAYILLCVLLSKPRSGYELKQLITIFGKLTTARSILPWQN